MAVLPHNDPGEVAAVLEALLELPIGGALGRDHLERLARIGRLEDHPAGTQLFEFGGLAEQLRLIVSGRVCLTLEAPGREPTVVAALSRGDMLGWSALRGWAAESRWTTSARVSKACRCLLFPGAALRELCDLDHELGFYVMRHAFEVVAQRLEDARMQLLDVYGSA